MKRCICFLLALIIFSLGSLGTGVPYDPSVYAATTKAAAKQSAVEATMRKGFEDFETRIEFVKKVDKYTKEKFDAFYDEIIAVHDRLMTEKSYFYVEDHITFDDSYSHNDEFHVFLIKKYICSKKDYKTYKAKFDKALKKVGDGTDKNWTDVQKAAYLHDRLISNTKYLKNGSSRYTATPYSALVDKKALCTGYSRAYAVLLGEVGIEAQLVSNKDHEWDLVKLGGRWYHVDCTYDDCDTFESGLEYPYNVGHEHFLKSDAALIKHTAYEPAGLATSSRFDKMDWSTYSPFAFYGKGIIYYDGQAVKVYDTSKNKVTRLFSAKDKWEMVWREYHGRSWTDHHRHREGGHVHIVQHGGGIYYNLAHGVYRYDPKTGKIDTVYTNARSDSMIVSIYVSNGALYGTFCDREFKEKDYVIGKI